MINIPGCEAFAKIEPINKGWSNDKKYYIETYDGRRLLLRIADASEYEHKKAQYDMLERVSKLDIPMSRPMDFGLCGDNKSVYQLLSWVDGEDVESVLPTMSKTEQYNYGLKAGNLLRKIHSVPAPEGTEDWDINFNRMLRGEINANHSRSELHCEPSDMIIKYLQENRNILGVRTQTYIHGDYNPGNLIIMPNSELGVIDFSSSYADPCWDIFKVSWRPNLFPHFYSGQIHGYFNSEPTLEFWNAYTYYFAFGALIALAGPQWAGFDNLEEGKSVMQNILMWSDNFKNPIPTWYQKQKFGGEK
ncbi:MAG: phosphotransferase [Ruminiclostridium sp.]|nr:phosphotransferase [Ruminiclostridium sp.]